jgi:hypothetical protein
MADKRKMRKKSAIAQKCKKLLYTIHLARGVEGSHRGPQEAMGVTRGHRWLRGVRCGFEAVLGCAVCTVQLQTRSG